MDSPGLSACVPIPGYYNEVDSSPSYEQIMRKKAEERAYWEEQDRLDEAMAWGALAINPAQTGLGVSAQNPSEEVVIENALKSRGRSGCAVVAIFKRGCAAFVSSQNKAWGVGYGPTFETSARAAMAQCKEKFPNDKCELWTVPTCSGSLFKQDISASDRTALLKLFAQAHERTE